MDAVRGARVTMSATAVKASLRCSVCGKRLRPDRCVVGRDKRLTDGHRLPRYCWPGEGCNR